MIKVYGRRLSYAQDGWLFQESPRAWAWHKAWLYEPSKDFRDRLKDSMPAPVAELIKVAYEKDR